MISINIKSMNFIKFTLLKGLIFLTFSSGFCQQETDNYSSKDHYNKKELTIEMRDGINLHTTVYSPKDTSIGNVYFGDNISTTFQRDVETKFFNHFLKRGW